VVRLPHDPVSLLAERLAAAVDDRTAAVLVSSVLFQSAHIVPGLGDVMRACDRVGAALLIDAYHALNVVPVSLLREGLQGAFVIGGGYKYCQLGEGNCFLRLPPGCQLRPVVTGWFSEFGALAERKRPGEVAYGRGPARFAGSTYDPTSHYRAAAVFDFFTELELTPALLRRVSQHQVGLLARRFDGLELDPAVVTRDRSVGLEGIGGFLALRSARAGELCGLLRERGVLTDHRADVLRFGPAPYLSDRQLESSMEALADAVRALPRPG
jgi:kynureninase